MQVQSLRSRRSTRGGHGNPLQYSCLENPIDGEALQAIVHWVTKIWTQLKRLSSHNVHLLMLLLMDIWVASSLWLWICLYVSFGECSCSVAKSCPTLPDPMDCSLPGFSIYGILQARILGWVPIPFFRESSWPRDQTQVSHISGRFFTIWATREALTFYITFQFPSYTFFTVFFVFVVKLSSLHAQWFLFLS